jgi:hypothetical protein
MKAKIRAYSADGKGAASNKRACVEYAKAYGLRDSQYVVVQEEHDNYCQECVLYVSPAGMRKIRKEQRKADENAHR